MKRREFLITLAGTAILVAAQPTAGANKNQKTLLIVELAGGNDGLNTFIPYRDPAYLKLRPTLGIRDGLPVSSTVAFHPALKELKPILDEGRLAVVQNVSYPNPNLSHFRSKDIWQSGRPQGSADTGWVARYLESMQARTGDAIFLGEEYPLTLTGDTGDRYLQLSPNLLVKSSGKLGQAIQSLYASPLLDPLAEQVRRAVSENQAAVKQLSRDLNQRLASSSYPQSSIGKQFALASKLLESNPKVVYLTIGGWDTHTAQGQRQQRLLEQLGQSLAAFNRDLKSRGLDKNVLVMVQSEFGRRPAQNGSGGTDHGTAGPVILMGAVRPGFYGGAPALDSLVQSNLPMQVDFRSVYAEILTRWLKADSKQVLGQEFRNLGFLV